MSGRTVRMVAVVALMVCAPVGAAVLPVSASPVRAVAARAAIPVLVFDSDMDFDDAATLAYLAEEDKLGRIDLGAVTVVNDGAGLPGKALRHAQCLLQRLGLPDVPVAEGSASAPNAFPLELRQTIDGVLDSALTGCPPMPAPTLTAAQLIRRVLVRQPRARVLVTGPLSNVAAALPVTAARVTSMGGAVRVAGNLCCGTPPQFDGSQEFNFWVDPPASRAVLRAGVRMMPLDAANSVPITTAFLDRLGHDHAAPAADLVLDIVSRPELAPLIAVGALFWWDPLAAVATVHPDIVDSQVRPLDVVTTGASAGRTVLSRTGRPTRFATTVAPAAFESRFLDTLNGRR
jgi:purine nucleosidase